jgi:methylmalonyl-CoA decarboxylase
MTGKLIEVQIDGFVGTVIMCNEKKRNVINQALIDEMVAAFAGFSQRKTRAVILCAGPGAKIWSAGHDVNELPHSGCDPLAYNDPLTTLLRLIQQCPMPVLAMIDGGVWGGAVDLALSSDIIIATPESYFCMTPARIGLPYNASGLLHFMAAMNLNVVREMFFTAKPLSAERGAQLGIVNHLVASGEIEEFTKKIAQTIAENSPLSIGVIKEQLRLLANAHPLSPLTFERIQGLRSIVYGSNDYREGIAAFHAKRKPVFTGE